MIGSQAFKDLIEERRIKKQQLKDRNRNKKRANRLDKLDVVNFSNKEGNCSE
jgi:hypothetical protein